MGREVGYKWSRVIGKETKGRFFPERAENRKSRTRKTKNTVKMQKNIGISDKRRQKRRGENW